ncbi:MAG: triose-phosphate isomerase [Ignavibacteria bacterium GWA2_54_16]|nr:MAG: triose-phosphate isomerase [Ignavibacteria bacterium GWA2_54_16]
MRPKIIAGNWKMNKDLDDSVGLLQGIKSASSDFPPGVKVIVCPPFTSLAVAQRILEGTQVGLGAQNMHAEDEGAFTGEISAKMLKSVGCRYVIVGHSERREYFAETNDLINKKARKALASGLIPIICVGETLDEREKNLTEKVVSVQTKGVLKEMAAADVEKSIIAYEPVWAIGTGKTATLEQAEEVHQLIRKLIGQLYTWATAEKVVIQYGGSVKPENARSLLSQPNIDGALVGGACLKADSFSQIVKAATGS